jgi:hypothetical protein
MLRDVMETQNAEYVRRLEDMENNQRDIAAKLDGGRRRTARERRTREKAQEDVLDLLARYAQQVT